MKLFLSRLRSYVVLDPLIWSYTIVLGLMSLASSLFDRGGRVQHGFARVWSWLILKTAMSPVEVVGLERVDTSKPHIYAANHISALDIPVIYTSLPFQFRIVAKRELFRYPFMGWHLRRSGQIPVDREDAQSSVRSLARGVETLRHGMPLVVFPEGGRSDTGQVKPFLPGAFFRAIRAQVEVVPMAIVGSYEVLPMNSFHIRPGKIRLLVGQPISTAGLKPRDMDALAARVQKAVEDLYYSRAIIADPRGAPRATELPKLRN